ncbi:hypothetical protein L596_004157 [Steinernema carpocapsae]|uniref:VWFA domain-containing protein n=1 Tax=Steinernema carpocapsae TaxID=34508 RepID=A0A4U8UVY6_STECR|nr:hypothetical protein L596_004157 [Steinernema carpocapsae]
MFVLSSLATVFSHFFFAAFAGDCPPKLDVVFLLDTSGSIEQIYEEHVKWTVALVNSLPIEKDAVRVAAVQYAGFPLTEFALGTYPNAQDIRQHLEQIHFQSGVTRTGYALRKAEAELFQENRGARSDAAKVIVLFTDGLSIDDPLKPAHQLRDIKGVKIYVVSVGSDGFEPEMNRIAGEKENVFGPSELSRLRTALLRDTERTRACSRIGKLPNQILKSASTLDDAQKFVKFPIEQAAVAQAQIDKIPEHRVKQLATANNGDTFRVADQLINFKPNTRRHSFSRFTTSTVPETVSSSRTTRRFRARTTTTTSTTSEAPTTSKSRFNKPRKEKTTTTTTTTQEPLTR